MKLAELKNKFKNRYVIRIIAGVVTVAVIGTSAGVYTVQAKKTSARKETQTIQEKDTKQDTKKAGDTEDELNKLISDNIKVEQKEVGKDETVYVIADNQGNTTSTIVSEWLKNPSKSDTLEDKSDLEEIENVKGKETFTKSGDKLTWDAGGKDIYYQGKTKKQAPITEKITYYLDGQEIAPKDLAGKSGAVRIRMDYTNNERAAITVDGKEEEVCVPFVAVSGMILNDKFTDVEVTNGRVVSDGKNNIIMGVAMPGLKDSLKLKDKDLEDKNLNIPDYVEVSAQVEDFSLDMTMTVAMASEDLSIDEHMDLSDLDDKIQTLTDASSQLTDGSGELSDGVTTLKNSLTTFSSGIYTLKSGIESYTSGAAQVADGITTLKNQSAALISGVQALDSSASALNNGIKTLDSALKTPMSDGEKQAASDQAGQQAQAAVDQQFADDTNPQSYNNIKNTAADTFYNSVANQDTINAAAQAAGAQAQQSVAQSLSQNGDVQNLVAVLTQGFVDLIAQQTMQESPDVQAQMEQQIAALVQGGVDETTAAAQVQTAAFASLQQDGNVQAQAAAQAQNAVNSLAQTVSGEVAGQVAGSVITNIASQAKDTVGTAVADAAKSGAKMAAESAAGQAAVAGAESAKSQIASQIETKDKKTGYSLVGGMEALSRGTGELNGNVPALSSGIDALYNGSQQLVENNGTLNSGIAQLTLGTEDIVKGVDQLNSGADELADGMVQFNEDGIQKLVNTYNGDVKSLIDRIQGVMDAGRAYETFTQKADNTAGSVKFIIKTDAVKAEGV